MQKRELPTKLFQFTFVIVFLLVFIIPVSAQGVQEHSSAEASELVLKEVIVGISFPEGLTEKEVLEQVYMLIEENGGRVIDENNELHALLVEVEEGKEEVFIKAIVGAPVNHSSPGDTNQSSPFPQNQSIPFLPIEYAERNCYVQIDFTPNDPYWANQWNMRIIDADDAWDIEQGSSTIIVAIVDTGVDYDHPDLAGNYKTGGYDWVNNDNSPMDDNGHGTHCAGIVAAVINNGVGVAGLAQVKILAEKSFDRRGSGTYWNCAQAITHAKNQGADIISMSWGGYSDSSILHDAIIDAYNAGCLLVAAAGNDGWDIPSYPAAYSEVISVAATDSNDQRPPWSNYGSTIELAAPGVGVFSTYWDDTYASLSGTSMACPHVSGVAALVWSLSSTLTNLEVRSRLDDNADDLGDPGWDQYYGYGRVNAYQSLPLELKLVSLSTSPPSIGTAFNLALDSPHNYPNNFDFTWTIVIPQASRVRVHFSRIDVENDYDYVRVYDGAGNQINEWCWPEDDIWSSYANGDTIKVRLTTDYSVVDYGFYIDRVDAGIPISAFKVPPGSIVYLDTTPSSGNCYTIIRSDPSGYSFSHWTVDGIIFNSGSYFLVDSDKDVVAHYGGSTSITCNLSSEQIDYGQSVTVSSQLTPPLSVGTTTLQYSTDGSQWTEISSGTPINGGYSKSWSPPAVGTYYVRAIWSGWGEYESSTSSSKTLRVIPVKESSSISCEISPSSLTLGESTTISGSISPSHSDVMVNLYYSTDGGASWSILISVTTDPSGSYSYTWKPGSAGNYAVKSSWLGDADHNGAESSVQTLTVVAPPTGGGGGGGEFSCSIPDYSPKEVSVAEGDEVQEAVTVKVYNMLGTDITAKVHVSISDPTGKEINSTTISVKVNFRQTKFLPVTLSFKPLTSGSYTIHAYAESSAIKPAGKTTEKTKSISVTVTSKAPPPPPAFVLPIEAIIAAGLIIAVVAGALWISMKRHEKPLVSLIYVRQIPAFA